MSFCIINSIICYENCLYMILYVRKLCIYNGDRQSDNTRQYQSPQTWHRTVSSGWYMAVSLRLMRRCYEDLYLVDFYPDIETCDKTVRKLVSMSGAGREIQMKHFMKMFFPDQSMALIDGTSIFTGNLYPALHKKIIRSMYRTGRCVFCAF